MCVSFVVLHVCYIFVFCFQDACRPRATPPWKEQQTDGRTPPQEQRDRDRQGHPPGTEGQRPPRSQGELKLRIFSIFTLVKLIRLRCVCHLLFYMFATYLFSVFRTHAAPAPPPPGRKNRRKDTPQEQRDRDRQGTEGQRPPRNRGTETAKEPRKTKATYIFNFYFS